MAESTGFEFLSSLQAEETELPSIERKGGGNGRARMVQDNPFVGWLQESYNAENPQESKGKQVTVPARHALKTEYLIRQAAEDLNIGVRIVRLVDGEQVKDKKAIKDLNPNKNVKLMFQGQKKRKYAPRKRSAGNTEE